MIRTLEERVAELERSDLVDDNAASPLMIDLVSRVAELEKQHADLARGHEAALTWVADVAARVAELEKLVGMMRHAIDVAVLTQFSPPERVLPEGYTGAPVDDLCRPGTRAAINRAMPDIEDSPLSPTK